MLLYQKRQKSRMARFKDLRITVFYAHAIIVYIFFVHAFIKPTVGLNGYVEAFSIIEYLDYPIGYFAFPCVWYLVYTETISLADVPFFQLIYFVVLGGLQWVLFAWLLKHLFKRKLRRFECGQCGYDVRGSMRFERCPECGTRFDPSVVVVPE